MFTYQVINSAFFLVVNALVLLATRSGGQAIQFLFCLIIALLHLAVWMFGRRLKMYQVYVI